MLINSGYPPVLARIYSARGINEGSQLDTTLKILTPFDSLKGICEMAVLLANVIAQKMKIMVVADYDADGATACTLAIQGLRRFGAIVDFIVPNRFEYGYGLTPEIVILAAQSRPDFLLTVDNGIASVEGVAEANRQGMQVLITDHHLPGDKLPDAACIVNPNQHGCNFPSKNLAGVGVMFYVLLALRAELRARGSYISKPEPKLADLLDIVALGTVADVVKLDQTNRILVQQGLRRIREGRACPGINALIQVAKKDPRRISSRDLGYSLGPRLNAAGRLDDMSLGINCLLAGDDASALTYAMQLDELNRERRNIESVMQDNALEVIESIDPNNMFSITLFDESWHQGVIGILASRLKDKFHRPTIAFARSTGGELKGSGRSISGFHLRDALDVISKRFPKLILKFGGHAAAAGLTINEVDLEHFILSFEQVAGELLDIEDLKQRIDTDGYLNINELNLEVAIALESQVWGQGFPEPLFEDDFEVHNQRVVGEKHLKLKLRHISGNASSECSRQSVVFSEKNQTQSQLPIKTLTSVRSNSHEQIPTTESKTEIIDAILFGYNEPLPAHIHAVYSLAVNDYRDTQSLQLIVKHWQGLTYQKI